MTDQKTKRITLECVAIKFSRGVYRAHLVGAGGACIEGTGSTEREAKDDLAASVAWSVHCSPTVVLDGEEKPWLLYPWGSPETWVTRRLTQDAHGIQRGSTVFSAKNFSRAREVIASWNAPHATEATSC